jgi:two-component system cell cycle response regulator
MSSSHDEPGDRTDKTEKTVVASETTLNRKMASGGGTPVLVVLIGPSGYQGKQWSLSDNFVIGRAVESQIFIDDGSVSRAHAKIEFRGAEVVIMDLGSTNKTVVNGSPLAPLQPVVLKNNDQVKTGNVVFKFLEKGNIEAYASKELFEKANRDALTGAHSKGALIERGPEVMKRSETLNEPLSVIVFDIDHFKKVNDTYGHPGGDFVLKELSRIIQTKLTRANDFFARYGGEEFVLILSGTPVSAAIDIAERIRKTIQDSQFIFEGKKIPVTVSVGCAYRKVDELVWDVLFDRADKALYQSKQKGRNRVTISP